MKTITYIKKEIGYLLEELRGEITPDRKARVKDEIASLNQLIRYMETNPSVEYLNKMKSEIEGRITSIERAGKNLLKREQRKYFANVKKEQN